MSYLWHGGQQESRYPSTYENSQFGPDHVCSNSFIFRVMIIVYCRKLPCPWEGCDFSTLQKSNLMTHYRRQCVSTFPPPHRDWCILLLLARVINHMNVLTTPPANANTGLVIRPHSSIIKIGTAWTPWHLKLGPPTQALSLPEKVSPHPARPFNFPAVRILLRNPSPLHNAKNAIHSPIFLNQLIIYGKIMYIFCVKLIF